MAKKSKLREINDANSAFTNSMTHGMTMGLNNIAEGVITALLTKGQEGEDLKQQISRLIKEKNIQDELQKEEYPVISLLGDLTGFTMGPGKVLGGAGKAIEGIGNTVNKIAAAELAPGVATKVMQYNPFTPAISGAKSITATTPVVAEMTGQGLAGAGIGAITSATSNDDSAESVANNSLLSGAVGAAIPGALAVRGGLLNSINSAKPFSPIIDQLKKALDQSNNPISDFISKSLISNPGFTSRLANYGVLDTLLLGAGVPKEAVAALTFLGEANIRAGKRMESFIDDISSNPTLLNKIKQNAQANNVNFNAMNTEEKSLFYRMAINDEVRKMYTEKGVQGLKEFNPIELYLAGMGGLQSAVKYGVMMHSPDYQKGMVDNVFKSINIDDHNHKQDIEVLPDSYTTPDKTTEWSGLPVQPHYNTKDNQTYIVGGQNGSIEVLPDEPQQIIPE